MTDIEKFFYSYPDINDIDLQKKITMKDEFIMPTNDKYPHQQIVMRYIVQYDRLLLFSSTGSGKTSVSVKSGWNLVFDIAKTFFESFLLPKRTNIRKIIIILSAETEIEQFVEQIVDVCLPKHYAQYKMESKDKITEKTKFRIYKSFLHQHFEFYSKESLFNKIFAGTTELNDVSEANIKYFDDTFIIIDEVHKFITEEIKTGYEYDKRYDNYFQIFHKIKRSKIIMMTATPIKNDEREIIKLMNLILPLDKLMPTNLDLTDWNAVYPYLSGYVSYYKKIEQVDLIEHGLIIQSTDNFDDILTIFPVKMSEFQSSIYRTVDVQQDLSKSKFMSSNIVYPSGNIGSKGFLENYELNESGIYQSVDRYKKYLLDKNNRLKISTKFEKIVDICDESFGLSFCYSHLKRSGTTDLASFFEARGYEQYDYRQAPVDTVSGQQIIKIPPKKRFAIIDGDTKKIAGKSDSIRNFYNNPKNATGEYLKIIIGSKAISTGVNLYNVLNIIIISPEWTESSLIQAIGRGIRSEGHKEIQRILNIQGKIKINLFKMVSVDTYDESFDRDMYVRINKKERNIQKVENFLKRASFDCNIMKEINYTPSDIDYSDRCSYDLCNYNCLYIPETNDRRDKSSFNILYSTDIKKLIQQKIRSICQIDYFFYYDDIYKALEGIDKELIHEVINNMHANKISVLDRMGLTKFLFFDDYGIYLSSNIINASSQIRTVEYNMFFLSQNIPINNLIKYEIDDDTDMDGIIYKLESIVKEMRDGDSSSHRSSHQSDRAHQSDMSLLHKYSFFIQEQDLVSKDISKEIKFKGRKRLHHKNDDTNEESESSEKEWVSYLSMLTHMQTNRYKILKDDWKVATKLEMKVLTHRFSDRYKKLIQPYLEKYGFCGLYYPNSDELRIVTNYQLSIGRVCQTYDKEKIIEYLRILKYKGEGGDITTNMPIIELCNIFAEALIKNDLIIQL